MQIADALNPGKRGNKIIALSITVHFPSSSCSCEFEAGRNCTVLVDYTRRSESEEARRDHPPSEICAACHLNSSAGPLACVEMTMNLRLICNKRHL